MLFSSVLTFVTAFVTGALLHYFLFRLATMQYVVSVLVLSMIASIIVIIMFVAYPLYHGKQRRAEIDSNLVYTAGYMGVLSAGGIRSKDFRPVIQVDRRPTVIAWQRGSLRI